MILFLTSSPTGPFAGENRRIVHGLDKLNGFADRLRERWKADSRCLIIAASPDEYRGNDEMCRFFRWALEDSGLTVSEFDIWDNRGISGCADGRTGGCGASGSSGNRLDGYDVVFLGGGHVPTQNRFFEEIGLRQAMEEFEGIVVGISAGTMNCAGRVYAQPELPGESADPDYRRDLQGLGLTWINVLPHYQMVKDSYLDGRRLIEDITCEDSRGREFYALTDGSYILIDPSLEEGNPRLFGEAYRISDGEIRQICREGESILLKKKA